MLDWLLARIPAAELPYLPEPVPDPVVPDVQFPQVSQAAPPVPEPEPEPEAVAVEPEQAETLVTVYTISATAEEFERIDNELDLLCPVVEADGWSDEEKFQARAAHLNGLEKLEIPPTFTYDSTSTPTKTRDGKAVDVYLVKGSNEELEGFNRAVRALGGELTPMDAEAVGLGKRAFQGFEEVCAARVAALDLDPFSDPEVQPEPAPKRRSPSRVRYQERHKYGVREAQLVSVGFDPPAARYISNRVKELQHAEWSTADAIETAQEEWLIFQGWKDELECFRLRKNYGFTTPRLIDKGLSRDEARLFANAASEFLLAGASMVEAADHAGRLVAALDTPDWGEVSREVAAELRKCRYDLFFVALTDAEVEDGLPDLEVPSGAQWIAKVAVDLLRETYPGTQRRYRLREALGQADREWVNMTPAARTEIRREWHQDRLWAIQEKRLGEKHPSFRSCPLCQEWVEADALESARRDEAQVFPPPPEVKSPFPQELAPLWAFLAAMAATPENLPAAGVR